MGRFEITYIDSSQFKIKIWINSWHISEYTFGDDGQKLLERRETKRFGGPRKRITTERQRWRSFKSEVAELSYEEQRELPAKFLRLFLWKYEKNL